MTGVGSADVAIVTVGSGATGALAVDAGVLDGARVAVLAGCVVVDIDTPLYRVATVVGAFVTVVTTLDCASQAPTLAALVAHSARVEIVAGFGVGQELTPDGGLAAIVRARVAVVAGKVSGRDALSQIAVITNGAQISVVTHDVVEQVQTADRRITRIGRADVVVIAGGQAIVNAFAVAACIAKSTLISIVTRGVVRNVYA